MQLPKIKWDIYEISSKSTPLTGVMLRGRIRKFCIDNDKNFLVENASDSKEIVRFAVPSGEEINSISEYLRKIIQDVKIEQVMKEVYNPVLSKLKVNLEERYEL